MRIFILDILYQSCSKFSSRNDKNINFYFRFWQRKWNQGRMTNFRFSKSLSYSHCFILFLCFPFPIYVLWCKFVNKSKNMKDEYMTSSLVPQLEMFKSVEIGIVQHQIGNCEFDTIPCCLNPCTPPCSCHSIYLICLIYLIDSISCCPNPCTPPCSCHSIYLICLIHLIDSISCCPNPCTPHVPAASQGS